MLVAAEQWGTPPWVVAGGSRLVWWLRWRTYRGLVVKAMEAKSG